ncbi:VanZ family protein [Streptomyces yaizuensis]|uniref:VanZ family protein n=1 Tax=Streptomyces yaizuensis TaxID=2989713 RepID=A0ABQ5NUP5_9ACTN|nr:VanZ family protein [Streptomyces sp. YSPA8]GLF94092.1 VanZ family protein [Streptomyces sp. YSPA8]
MWQIVLFVSPVTVALFLLASLALALVLARWRERADARRVADVTRGMLAVCVAVVLVATVLPTQPLGSGGHSVSWVPGGGLWGTGGGYGGAGLFAEEADMIQRLQIANAAMFVPLGTLLAFLGRRIRVAEAVFWCFAGSLAIEAAQFVMAAGRTVDVDDILCNTLGGALGAVAARVAIAIARCRPVPTGLSASTRKETGPHGHRR